MNLAAIMEVAIGTIFVWITLSLATIQFQKWISTWLDERAKDMEVSIHEKLTNPKLKAQFSIVSYFRRPVRHLAFLFLRAINV